MDAWFKISVALFCDVALLASLLLIGGELLDRRRRR